MKKLFILLFGLICAFPAWADVDLGSLLNKISMQLQSEQWVTTKTALVNVAANAAVSDQGIADVQADVMGKLKQLSDKGDWHITSFNRSLDQSGLESIQITAQARLPQTDLAGLRNKAKAISKPGETFTIDSVQFTPSEDEFRQANITLRNNLYQQAKAEIDALNKIYPDQKYYLYSIDFISVAPVVPVAMAMNALSMEKSVNHTATPISVGNKVQQQATVVIASMPDVVTQKLVHNP
jgi:hypothetical protein